MSDYDFPDDEGNVHGTDKGAGGGFSLQTGASILLIAVIAAVLWLFFGPIPDQEAALPTATATRPALAVRTGTTTAGTPGGIPVTPTGPVTATAPVVSGTSVVAASPGNLQSGGFARVTNTDGFGIRYRFGPGTEFITIRIVEEGEVLQIDGPPEQAEGFTWYRLRDSLGNIGWAVADFLEPAPAPGQWSPPAASPTFAISGDSDSTGDAGTPAAP